MISLSILNPSVSLLLRIDHQRETRALCDENCIFLRELIIGKSLEVPVKECNRLHEEIREVVILRMLDLQVADLSEQCFLDECSSIFRRERTCVRHECCRHKGITDKEFEFLFESNLSVFPAFTSTFETRNKLFSSFLLILKHFILIFKILFICSRLI